MRAERLFAKDDRETMIAAFMAWMDMDHVETMLDAIETEKERKLK